VTKQYVPTTDRSRYLTWHTRYSQFFWTTDCQKLWTANWVKLRWDLDRIDQHYTIYLLYVRHLKNAMN